ncbi:M14 metallopeptidase family protein [Acidobacteriota bacterium]
MKGLRSIKKDFSGFIIALFLFPFFLGAQTSPEAFLGFKVGADRKLADYGQIKTYFEKLDQESPILEVLEIGTSTLNKPMIMAVITSEDNLTKLDSYKEISRKLRNARDLSAEEAKRMSKEGKAILLITCNIHATEIASAQMSMELAYKLVTGDTPFDLKKALDEVIILLVPTTNPDGEQLVTEWYRKYVGTKYEGGRMPWLYHPYSGHDNNRDWFMLNFSETKAVTKVLYHDWLPQVHIDEHQMGSTGARLWVPPYNDPPHPTIHPLLWSMINFCGSAMALDVRKQGYKGVVQAGSYSASFIGGCEDTGWWHNVVALLSEMASVRVATPFYMEPTEIPDRFREQRVFFPDPWPGGWWRLRDLVDYELALSLSLIKTVHLSKEDFLFNFYSMCKDGIEKRNKGDAFAYIVPPKQHDYPTMLRMIEILMLGGVEVHQAKEDFTADGKTYPKGTFVIQVSQPYKPYVQVMMELSRRPIPTPDPGFTLPLQMGVVWERIERPFEANMERFKTVPTLPQELPQESSPYILLDSRANASYSVVFSLLKDAAEIYRSKDKIKSESNKVAAGSFIIKNSPQVQKALPGLLGKWHLNAYGIEDISDIPKASLKNNRIGLYQSWAANMDEGWTRFVFDDLEIPFTTLDNKDFKGTRKEKANLKSKYDVIVFADEDPDIIKTGRPSPTSPRASRFSALPPEYEGGLGKEGIEALKAFVEQGGILVTLNSACNLAFKEFQVPARNALERVDRAAFSCPASMLKVNVDNKSPIGYGMPAKAAAKFVQSLAMDTWIPSGEWDRKVVASFPDKDILLSGWLTGEKLIARKAAIVDTQFKKGHIILIGIRCQDRAQPHGTYKFLLNALLYPGQ